MMELLRRLFMPEIELSEEEKAIEQWATPVRDNNWVKLHQLAREHELSSSAFFEKVAEAYCYVYAAKVEPTRNDAWTSFRKTLENLQYPLLSQAIELRARDERA